MNAADFGIGDGLAVVVIGFAMVFIILAFISFILSIFSYVNKVIQKRNAEIASETKTIESNQNNNILLEDNKEDTLDDLENLDDLEIVAAITAAIAASMNTSSDKLVIHSIRKTSDWKKAAIQENQKTYY